MQSFWFSVIFLFIVVIVLDYFLGRMYQNKKQPHSSTPKMNGIAFEEINIPLSGGKNLYGWWIEATPDAPTLILVHGWSRNLSRMIKYIDRLQPLGYNLLAFDARNHGSSASEKHPTVWTFTEDILSTIKFITASGLVSTNKIGIIGLSIGGGAAINASSLNPLVTSVITVGALSHPYDVMRQEFAKKAIPDMFPKILFKYMGIRFGIDFNNIAPVNNIHNAKAKILLIHGDQDMTIPLTQGQELKKSGNPEKTELWVVPGKGHSDCEDYPEFWERVRTFLELSLPVSE